jgi:hypothetical protein
MITIGIAVSAGIFYWFGLYNWAFVILVYAIVNGAGAAIYAVINPNWYYRKALSEGVMPNYTHLFISKGIVIAILVPSLDTLACSLASSESETHQLPFFLRGFSSTFCRWRGLRS